MMVKNLNEYYKLKKFQKLIIIIYIQKCYNDTHNVTSKNNPKSKKKKSRKEMG